MVEEVLRVKVHRKTLEIGKNHGFVSDFGTG